MNTTIPSKTTVRTFATGASRLVAMLALAALVMSLITTLYLRAPQIKTSAPAFTLADHSYDDIEHVRSQRSQSVALNAQADHSYDDIERVRSQRGSVLPKVAADHSYDDIEHVRSTRDQSVVSNGAADHSYDDIERVRSTR